MTQQFMELKIRELESRIESLEQAVVTLLLNKSKSEEITSQKSQTLLESVAEWNKAIEKRGYIN